MKVLVFSPHPDDEAIGCGGVLRRHVLQGDDVRVVFFTSGEGGGHGRAKDETLDVRENEARRAASILGIPEPEFWREQDGSLRANRALTLRVAKTIEEFRAELIYVPSGKELHPDHRAAARLIRAARRLVTVNPRVLMFEVWTPLDTMDEIVDITPFMETKLAAVRAYRSQCSVLRFDEAIEGLARYRGELFCWPKYEPDQGRYAEVFQVQKT